MERATWALIIITLWLPAAIGAVSSLANGRILRRQERDRKEAAALLAELKLRKKKTPSAGSGDWYQAPDLD